MTPDRSGELRIVVTGLAVTYPFGGVFWDYVQYPLGFARLGHRVLYLEDTGKFCYAPRAATFVADGSDNAAHFAEQLERCAPELQRSWYYRGADGREYGLPWSEVVEFCRGADLFLHVSVAGVMREEYHAARLVALLDSDPLYTQGALPPGHGPAPVPWRLARHDAFLTFGERIGRSDCTVPTGGLQWFPTRQPLVLDCFTPFAVPPAARRRCFTTVCSWEPHEGGPVIDGRAYGGKSRELLRFLELPARAPLPLELALSGPAPLERLQSHGFVVRPAYEVSADAGTYRDYLARSFGEWSVAKNAYVAARTGWFSCRSACYLALGVPVVVQDTGFTDLFPTGEGLLAFDDVDGAAAALAAVASAPERHANAAREIAREYFAHDRVLPRLLADLAVGADPGCRREGGLAARSRRSDPSFGP